MALDVLPLGCGVGIVAGLGGQDADFGHRFSDDAVFLTFEEAVPKATLHVHVEKPFGLIVWKPVSPNGKIEFVGDLRKLGNLSGQVVDHMLDISKTQKTEHGHLVLLELGNEVEVGAFCELVPKQLVLSTLGQVPTDRVLQAVIKKAFYKSGRQHGASRDQVFQLIEDLPVPGDGGNFGENLYDRPGFGEGFARPGCGAVGVASPHGAACNGQAVEVDPAGGK